MKIYLNGISVSEAPTNIRRPGELFTRLVGFNVSGTEAVSRDGNKGNWIFAEPRYVPLVRWRKQAGQFLIEVNSYSRPLAYITLQARRPFVNVFRFHWDDINEG